MRILYMKYTCRKCNCKIEGYAEIIPEILSHEKTCGQGYWKPCSFQEFLEASCLSMEKKRDRSSNMLTGLKEQFRQIKDEDADNKKQ